MSKICQVITTDFEVIIWKSFLHKHSGQWLFYEYSNEFTICQSNLYALDNDIRVISCLFRNVNNNLHSVKFFHQKSITNSSTLNSVILVMHRLAIFDRKMLIKIMNKGILVKSRTTVTQNSAVGYLTHLIDPYTQLCQITYYFRKCFLLYIRHGLI